jgi:ribulose 1,5-bisphosphate synthetase/thiazole synthase
VEIRASYLIHIQEIEDWTEERNMGKKIVIVGAGYSGILTAKKLAKKLKTTRM